MDTTNSTSQMIAAVYRFALETGEPVPELLQAAMTAAIDSKMDAALAELDAMFVSLSALGAGFNEAAVHHGGGVAIDRPALTSGGPFEVGGYDDAS